MTCVLDCIFLPFCLVFVLVRKVLSDLQKHFIFRRAHEVNDSTCQQPLLASSHQLLFFCLRCPSLSRPPHPAPPLLLPISFLNVSSRKKKKSTLAHLHAERLGSSCEQGIEMEMGRGERADYAPRTHALPPGWPTS